MGRMFQATIDSASATTQRDVVEVVAASEVPIVIHELYISTDIETDTNEAQFELQIARYVGAFTSGSGGSTVTAYALGVTGATEDSTTVEVGNTTQITGGTSEVLGNVFVNNRIGYHYLPAPESRIYVAGTDAFAVSMQAAFGAATAFGGFVVFEELVS